MHPATDTAAPAKPLQHVPYVDRRINGYRAWSCLCNAKHVNEVVLRNPTLPVNYIFLNEGPPSHIPRQ